MSDPSDKSNLRAALRKRRRVLARQAPDAALAAAAHAPVAELGRLGWFSSYHAMGTELDPGPLAQRLIAAGGRLAMPATLGAERPLAFRQVRAGDVPVPDAFGVPSPPPQAPEVAPRLVICPLLAFDAAGGRLGQGGGHYDRTLAALRAQGPVFVLGLAYAGQQVEALDMEPHDQRLDAILTETGYTRFRKD